MIVALSLLGGVLLGLLSPAVPGIAWQCAGVVLLVGWAASCWRHVPGSRACAALLAGQILATAHAHHWTARLPDTGASSRVLAEGLVAGIPEREGAIVRFHLRVESLAPLPDDGSTRMLRVEWRDPHAAPRVGERWRLLLRLLPLEETRNFSGRDVARLAFREGVHARGRVLESSLNELLVLAPASLDTLRARIAARVRESIADRDAAALVTALAVGITADMSREQWRVFNATGTTHLVAISGLHVTLFAWLAFRGARFLWGRLPGNRLVSREGFALLLGLAAAGGYALLAGLSVPTQRTWLMLALYVAARLSARRVAAGTLWSVALVLVLLWDARAPLAAGFWLSFIAVGALLAFADDGVAQDAGTLRWRTALRAQVIVTLALVPASIATFGGVSLVGLVVNLVAIPVISLVFVPLVLGGALLAWLAPAWDTYLLALAARLHEWLWPGLTWCADLELADFASTWRAAPHVSWFLLALPASLVWLCRWPVRLRLTAACALLPLLFATPRSPARGEALVEILDAGRGSAVLIRTLSHDLLFDTGDAWNTRGTRLAQIVLPAMHDAQVGQLDALVLPTLDEDRARAAALLALERAPSKAWVGGGWPGNGIAVPCRDSRWRWDGVEFAAFTAGRHCVLRVFAGRGSLLLPGDLDAAGERAMLARLAPRELASDVVVIGRQASEQASTRQWIGTLAPGLAVATGGILHAQSRQRVLDRWREQGARILDTRRDGAVVLALSARGVEVRAVARTSRYPFHWRRPV